MMVICFYCAISKQYVVFVENLTYMNCPSLQITCLCKVSVIQNQELLMSAMFFAKSKLYDESW